MFRSLPVLALAGALFLAGCGTQSAGTAAAPPSASPSPTADTRDAVTVVKESFQRTFDTKTFTMTVHISAGTEQSADMSANVDLAKDAVRMSMELPTGTTEVVKLADDMFIKAPGLGKKPYLRLDLDKLNPSSPLRESLNVANQSGILDGVVTANKGAGDTYAGTADLKKAAEVSVATQKKSLEQMSRLAKNASAVPYTAKIDEQGRLTELSYTVELSTGEMTTEILLTALGEPVTVDRPAADQVADATEEQYAFF
ncbi:hypothetical protein [Asanoa sp. NPDC050611]|uniref:hypothetical protein n=1 Tax=Asanoa sp. NPDC050611 TaxID=3157098 RepID=UPI0033E0EB80